MDKEKNLDYFNNIKYDVVIKKRGNKFFLYLPELSLVEEDENLDKAYEKLESEKVKYFQDMIKMEAQDEIIEPTKLIKSGKKLLESLVLFSGKLAIVLFISGVAFLFLYIQVKPIWQSIFQMTQLISKPDIIIDKTANYLNQMVIKINEMPEIRKKRIRSKMREILRQAKSFFDEIKLLFEDKFEEEVLTKNEIKKGVKILKRYLIDLRSLQKVIPSVQIESRIDKINYKLLSFKNKLESLKKEKLIAKKEITKVVKNFRILVREVQASKKDFFLSKEEVKKGKLEIDAILKQLKLLVPYNKSSEPR